MSKTTLLIDLHNDEMKQIEEWTGMKIGNVIFDSDIDNWKEVTSTFDQKIINKSNLLFLIEEEDGNLFGGYINALIGKYDEFIKDPKAFVFSLKSNGRLNGMTKFDIAQPQYAFYLNNKNDIWLFSIGYGGYCGYDISFFKQTRKNVSFCTQWYSFEYNKIEKALCGKKYPERMTPVRITVFQLV